MLHTVRKGRVTLWRPVPCTFSPYKSTAYTLTTLTLTSLTEMPGADYLCAPFPPRPTPFSTAATAFPRHSRCTQPRLAC
jgi:hypothetical protein